MTEEIGQRGDTATKLHSQVKYQNTGIKGDIPERHSGESSTEVRIDKQHEHEQGGDPSTSTGWEENTSWCYIGHGEWAPPEETEEGARDLQLDKDPEWVYAWRCQHDADIKLHQEVLRRGYPNRWGA